MPPRHSNEERGDALEIIGALEGLEDDEADNKPEEDES